MALEIEITDQDRRVRRVALRGRLDTQTAPALDERLRPLLAAAEVSAVVFDLGGLEYVSSAGIRSFVKARKALEGRGGRVAVANLRPAVRKVFDIVRALPSSDIFASADELDAYLDAMQRRVTGES